MNLIILELLRDLEENKRHWLQKVKHLHPSFPFEIKVITTLKQESTEKEGIRICCFLCTILRKRMAPPRSLKSEVPLFHWNQLDHSGSFEFQKCAA
ncbi:hypothetical protein CDAR_478491 [Caerostris darwini]|uniref:Uncharacterized protein n=1 Tax=Caerostris darwini TaxID=1538125 RepID=A0AAV4QND9_9ARAC|nr:hypothetical protein CDAR_478491 [Caerostris darwini]